MCERDRHAPRLLVLATDYSRPDGYVNRMYVHVRNLYYARQGYAVTVLNFSAKADYALDGISVITLKSYRRQAADAYQLLICHAANLRNHYRFLKRYRRYFANIVFFFHGHEILRVKQTYPRPYAFRKRALLKRAWIQPAYDAFKLALWKRYFLELAPHAQFVFVSQFLCDRFFASMGLPREALASRTHIIPNAIGEAFQHAQYDEASPKAYDFLTIRSAMDEATYAVDRVTAWARCTPQARFLLVGRGHFFEHTERPANLTWLDATLSHADIISRVNESACALMPTRHDTQGVMACEMASMGMPCITSDIPICHEILGGFENVAYVQNDAQDVDLCAVYQRLKAGAPYPRVSTYDAEHTMRREVALFAALGYPADAIDRKSIV